MSISTWISRSASIALAVAVVAIVPFSLAQAATKDAKPMLEKNGCFACHGIGAKAPKMMGPNYAAVAAKFAKDPKAAAKLAAKIRKGGAGSFGQVPMPPQAQVSEADAKEMALWVLKQKGK